MESIAIPVSTENGKELFHEAAKLNNLLGEHINEEENNGRLSSTVVSALREAGFYKLFLPVSLGGLEAAPLSVAKVVEEVASHNTAAGWSLMVTVSPEVLLAFPLDLPPLGVAAPAAVFVSVAITASLSLIVW